MFEAALGIAAPWSVGTVDFDEAAKILTVQIDFRAGTRFAISGYEGVLTNSERGMPLAASLAHSALPAEHNAFRFSKVA